MDVSLEAIAVEPWALRDVTTMCAPIVSVEKTHSVVPPCGIPPVRRRPFSVVVTPAIARMDWAIAPGIVANPMELLGVPPENANSVCVSWIRSVAPMFGMPIVWNGLLSTALMNAANALRNVEMDFASPMKIVRLAVRIVELVKW